MTTKRCILSSSGLRNLIEYEDDKQFTFIFNDKEIRMSNTFSEFISPRVSHLHHSDPTIDKLHINYDIHNNKTSNEAHFNDEIYTLFTKISSGQEIDIRADQSNQLRQLSIILWNEELFNKLNELYPIKLDDRNINEILQMIENFYKITKSTGHDPFHIPQLIESVSSNFYQISNEKFKGIDKRILLEIIASEKLKIETEDSLLDMIDELFEESQTKRGEEEDEYEQKITIFDFYDQIYIQNLSEEKFHQFVERIDHQKLSRELWQKIVQRIVSKEKSSAKENSRYTKKKPPGVEILFDGEESHKLNGIIRHLTKECGGNVHEKGVIKVTASSEQKNDARRLAKNVVDFDNKDSMHRTNNEEGSWLMYNFNGKKVRPTHYSIMSKPYGSGHLHPQHWVIEGSNTNTNDWKILDRRNGVTSLNAASVTQTFEIKEQLKSDEFYQFLRIRQTGKNAHGSYYLGFSALEYFGTMI